MNVARHKKLVPEIEGFEIPSWSGKPSSGLHLDVLKEKEGEVKMISKMMVDEKNAYFFGRNPLYCDFPIDHASCSRVHAVLLFHKNLNKSFLVDLNSAHGTFIGKVRLESFKPTQIHPDSVISFGASTRQYILRERLQTAVSSEDHRSDDVTKLTGLAKFGLPHDEAALDNLTEYNTAHNKRVATTVTIDENSSSEGPPSKRARFIGVRFREEEDVINPEDVDPTVGKFRDLIQTAVIPKANRKSPQSSLISPTALDSKDSNQIQHHILRPIKDDSFNLYAGLLDNPIGSIRINSAPDVDLTVKPDEDETNANPAAAAGPNQEALNDLMGGDLMPRKKYFPKEAWPGRKPTGGMAI